MFPVIQNKWISIFDSAQVLCGVNLQINTVIPVAISLKEGKMMVFPSILILQDSSVANQWFTCHYCTLLLWARLTAQWWQCSSICSLYRIRRNVKQISSKPLFQSGAVWRILVSSQSALDHLRLCNGVQSFFWSLSQAASCLTVLPNLFQDFSLLEGSID